jgi:hypothetical protein
MASTYSTNLALELIGNGDQAGSWGNTTNNNLGVLIEQAVSGYVTQAVVTGTDTTITIPNGATGVARNMYIELTGTGGASTNLVVPANKKLYFIFNNSTGAVTVKVSGQTGVSVPAAAKMSLVCNGTDVVSAVTYFAALSSAALTLSSGSANGVAYLNASKVVTAGTALTFDGVQTLQLFASGNSILNLEGSTTNNGVMRFRNGTTGALSGLVGDNSKDLVFEANGATERMRLDAAGNLGLNVTPPAHGSSERSIDIGTTVGFGRQSDGALVANFNAYLNASAQYIYRISSSASRYEQLAGQHKFFTAASGTAGNQITFTQAMTLDSSGNLGIGLTNPTSRLELYGGAAGTATYATIGNATTAGLFGVGTGNDVQVRTAQAVPITFYTSGIERMRLDSSGNLGIGTSSPPVKFVVSNAGANGFEFDPTTGIAQTYNRSGAAYTGYKIYGLDLEFRAGASPAIAMTIDSNRNIVAGASAALLTTATNGFLYVPTCAGTPTGVPTAITGMAPIVVDTTNNKLYFYSSGVWRDAGP